jgi:outer membrane protein assembly factor BamB
LAASPTGLLVSTSDGALLALKPDGTRRWKQPTIGDLIGTPAEVDGVAAIIDRQGRVHTFAASDGKVGAVLDAGDRPAHGLTVSGHSLVAQLRDGSVRVYDLRSGTLVANVKLSKKAAFPLAPVGEDALLLPLGEGRMGLVATPRNP